MRDVLQKLLKVHLSSRLRRVENQDGQSDMIPSRTESALLQ